MKAPVSPVMGAIGTLAIRRAFPDSVPRSGASREPPGIGWGPDSELQRLATVDDERFALMEAADVVGVDDVAVPGALAAEAGVVEGLGLFGPLQDPFGPGQGGNLVGLFELMNDHGADGAGQAVSDGVVGAETGPRLGDEHDADVEAPGPFDEVDGGAGAVGELGELVHDHQRVAVGVFAGQGPVEDVLEEEGADFGGLVSVLGSADGDVGGPAVFVGPGAVQGGADRPGDPVVAGSYAGHVLVGQSPDCLQGVGVVSGGALEGSFVEAGDELAERAGWLVADCQT